MCGIMHALIDECIYQFLSPLASTGQSFASRAVSSPQTASCTPCPRAKRRLDSTYCRNAHPPACPRTAVSRTPANLPSRWMSLRESSCSPHCRRLLLLVRTLRLTNAVSLAQCIASSLPMDVVSTWKCTGLSTTHGHHIFGCAIHRGIKNAGREPNWKYHKILVPFCIPS